MNSHELHELAVGNYIREICVIRGKIPFMDLKYQTGFGNEFATEAVAGALPVGRNSPQRAPRGALFRAAWARPGYRQVPDPVWAGQFPAVPESSSTPCLNRYFIRFTFARSTSGSPSIARKLAS